MRDNLAIKLSKMFQKSYFLNKNSSGDEIANVNFFTTTSHDTSKYNPLLNIQRDAAVAPQVGVASWY